MLIIEETLHKVNTSFVWFFVNYLLVFVQKKSRSSKGQLLAQLFETCFKRYRENVCVVDMHKSFDFLKFRAIMEHENKKRRITV